MPPVLSIIIVNYNAGEHLARCLKSVERQTFRDFEVIVIDNASRDQSITSAESLDWITVVRNSDNRGFAAAQNQGMRISRGKYLMPLNFDVYLTPDFVAHAVRALDCYPTIGTVSGKMLRMQPDGEWTNEFDNAGLLLDRQRMPRHRGKGEQDSGQYQDMDLVFGAMGSAPVFRRRMLDDIAYKGAYFDESYFTWWEDVDLDWRGRLRGWDCLYVPQAVAYHVGDPQNNQATPFAARHGIRNRWQMILANECMHCMLHNMRWLLLNEVRLLRHVIKYRRLSAYLKAAGEFIWSLPAVLAKRRWVRSQAKRPCLPVYPQSLDL